MFMYTEFPHIPFVVDIAYVSFKLNDHTKCSIFMLSNCSVSDRIPGGTGHKAGCTLGGMPVLLSAWAQSDSMGNLEMLTVTSSSVQ